MITFEELVGVLVGRVDAVVLGVDVDFAKPLEEKEGGTGDCKIEQWG